MNTTYVYIIAGIIAVLVIFFLIWVLFLRRRLGPPVEQVKDAEAALSAARQKEADLYAQDEYQRAEDSLARAKHLLAAKEYKKAKEAAEDTITQAGKADKVIEENKAKMKAENEKMFADFDKQVDELKQWAAKRGTDTPTNISPKVQELVGKWEIIKVKLPDLIQRGRIKEAHDELKAVERDIQTRRQDFAVQAGDVK
jgi:Domain of unknown function (DUF4398)